MPEILVPLDVGPNLSEQVIKFGNQRGRADQAGNTDLSGLAILQGSCTYVVTQSAIKGWATETIYGKRRWLPFREQGVLNITPFFERYTETRKVEVFRTAIDVTCYVFGGETTSRYRHQDLYGRDAFELLLETLDQGVHNLGSVSGVCTEAADHIGWLPDEAARAYDQPV